jgi:hypothetical protein
MRALDAMPAAREASRAAEAEADHARNHATQVSLTATQ